MIGAQHLGCYGDPLQVTPTLDRLSKNGIQFTRAYAAASPCIPARACMMTGMYAHTHGKMSHIHMNMDERIPLLPALLSKHGYYTCIIGKTHWYPPASSLGALETHVTIDNHLTPELGKQDAYIRFLEEEGIVSFQGSTWETDQAALHPDNLADKHLKVNWTGWKACKVLDRLSNTEQPFFLFVSFVEPHGHGSVKTERLEHFLQKTTPPPREPSQEGYPKSDVQQRAARAWMGNVSTEQIHHYRAGVYASLNLVDHNIARIMDTLDRTGLLEQSTILFTSDHGDLMFDYGLQEKTFLYDPAVRIPFILSNPDLARGIKLEHLVSQIDIAPTVCEMAGIAIEGLNMEGRSVLPICRDSKQPWRKMVFCEADQLCHIRNQVEASRTKMVRDTNWKYIYSVVNNSNVQQELYNMNDDPEERYNLANVPDYQDRCVAYQAELLRWITIGEENRLYPVSSNPYPLGKKGCRRY